ncbi:MAG: NUDIX hydrolase, partial [Minisyncoccia bacterium]
ESAIIREVREETNLDFTIREKFKFYSGVLNNTRYVSMVFLGSHRGELKINDESISARYVSYEESLGMDIAFSYAEVLSDLHDSNLI